jgi:hypothetical protein
MKHTAVEQLQVNLSISLGRDIMRILFNEFEQAKEMEKQKLEQFYNHGQWAVIENGHGECFDDYYNRIFKQIEQ